MCVYGKSTAKRVSIYNMCKFALYPLAKCMLKGYSPTKL